MVLLHVKAAPAEEQEFLYECPCITTVDAVAAAITEISNLQARVQSLSAQLRRLLLTDDLKVSSPEAALAVDRVLSEAEIYASKDQVLHKRTLSSRILGDHLVKMEREVSLARSKGLCDDDAVELFSECKHIEDSELWWAGKKLSKGKNLSDYIGLNEKTKIVVRLKPTRTSS